MCVCVCVCVCVCLGVCVCVCVCVCVSVHVHTCVLITDDVCCVCETGDVSSASGSQPSSIAVVKSASIYKIIRACASTLCIGIAMGVLHYN